MVGPDTGQDTPDRTDTGQEDCAAPLDGFNCHFSTILRLFCRFGGEANFQPQSSGCDAGGDSHKGGFSVFTYRLAVESDREIWIKLNREFMAEEIQDADLWNNTGETGDEQFGNTFKKARASDDMIRLMLFEADSQVIGFANLLIIFSVWSHGKALIIDDLYITKENRGKGFGRSALAYIEEYARQLGCKRLQFQSELTNPDAMEFYKAVGYTPADMKFYVKYL